MQPSPLLSSLLWALQLTLTAALSLQWSPAQGPSTKAISVPFMAALERLARLVDVTYCVGTTGIGKPFECVSRCSEFPTLSLVTTWNTGPLMSDSCGYIAVDHGVRQHNDQDVDDVGHGAIIVAFRGTYSIANTIVDLSTVPQKYVPYPSPHHGGGEPPEKPEHECHNCTVHMGFLESWKHTREVVIPELKLLRARYPSYSIQLVGHSLGGSIACLAALELKVSMGWDKVLVTTFGEPRVGNKGLAQFIDDVFQLKGVSDLESRSYRRVTHINDPVPLLPLGEWGYRSHSGEIYIAKSDLSPSEDDVYMCIGGNDPSCIADADGSLWNLSSEDQAASLDAVVFPPRLKLWQLFFAHRDYFWRLGLCVPGGDPANWGRGKYGHTDGIGEL